MPLASVTKLVPYEIQTLLGARGMGEVFSYDVSKEGKRFLVNRYVKPERITPLTIVLHAGAE